MTSALGSNSAGPDDQRQYVRIAVDLPHNLKFNAMSEPLVAIAASVIAICTSAASFTDGHVPLNAIRRAGISETIIKEMITENVWHDEEHVCSRCTERPRPGQIYIHDYLRHQRSGATVRDLKSKRAAAGAAGAAKRWEKHRAAQNQDLAVQVKKAKAKGEPSPVRDDVEKLCEYLAKLVQHNDSQGRKPSIGKAWRDDMRKMIDIDKFTPQQLGQVIKWSQSHSFWYDKIKSPHKLRHQLRPDTNDLMAKMRAEQGGRAPGTVAAQPSRAATALSVADRLDAQYGTESPKEIIA